MRILASSLQHVNIMITIFNEIQSHFVETFSKFCSWNSSAGGLIFLVYLMTVPRYEDTALLSSSNIILRSTEVVLRSIGPSDTKFIPFYFFCFSLTSFSQVIDLLWNFSNVSRFWWFIFCILRLDLSNATTFHITHNITFPLLTIQQIFVDWYEKFHGVLPLDEVTDLGAEDLFSLGNDGFETHLENYWYYLLLTIYN